MKEGMHIWWEDLKRIYTSVFIIYMLILSATAILFVVGGTIVYIWTHPITIYHSDVVAFEKMDLSGIFNFCYLMVVIPYTLTAIVYINKEFFSKYYPEFGARMYGGDMKVVRVANVKGKEIRINCFENIKLEYETYGDFKKQLTNVDINPVMYKIEKKGILSDDIAHWEAVFRFEKKPRNGFIEVRFR